MFVLGYKRYIRFFFIYLNLNLSVIYDVRVGANVLDDRNKTITQFLLYCFFNHVSDKVIHGVSSAIINQSNVIYVESHYFAFKR